MGRTFSELGISKEMEQLLQKNGLTEPTPVQEKAIPHVLADRDVIAQAHTGTGKTLAFVLPILEKLNAQSSDVQGLIITPTRELAIQITAEVRKYTENTGARVLAVYGGQDVEAQIHKLQGSAHIVVATPGRLLDHLRRGTIDLMRLRTLVLDEADQMLHMGFLPEVEEIIRQTTSQRQTLLFSATIPNSVRKLAGQYMDNPTDVRVMSQQATVPETEQYVVETTDRGKLTALVQMIKQYYPYLAVVFCRTKIRAKKLTQSLLDQGVNVDELHGDLTQAKRESVMKRFREAKIQILVATDVAARGLDVEGVTHVFNYDIPHDVESYIHRIGRTGRAGDTGMAITLVAPRDRMHLDQIERVVDRLQRLHITLPDDVGSKRDTTRTTRESSGSGRKSSASRVAGNPRGRSHEGRGESRHGRNDRGKSTRHSQGESSRGRDRGARTKKR